MGGMNGLLQMLMGGGGAATGGASMLLPLLLSGGTALGGLLGGNQDPFQQYLGQLNKITNPGNIGADTNAFYKQFLGSPAFSAAQTANMGAANSLRNQMAGRLGASGLGATGIGQAAQGMAGSQFGGLQSKLYSGGWQGAQDMASRLAQLRVSGLGGAPQPWNMSGNLFGAGMGGLGDILKWYLNQQGAGNS